MRGGAEEREEGREEREWIYNYTCNDAKGREGRGKGMGLCTNDDVQQSEARQYQKHTLRVWLLTQHSATLPPDPLLQPPLPRRLVLQTRKKQIHIFL